MKQHYGMIFLLCNNGKAIGNVNRNESDKWFLFLYNKRIIDNEKGFELRRIHDGKILCNLPDINIKKLEKIICESERRLKVNKDINLLHQIDLIEEVDPTHPHLNVNHYLNGGDWVLLSVRPSEQGFYYSMGRIAKPIKDPNLELIDRDEKRK